MSRVPAAKRPRGMALSTLVKCQNLYVEHEPASLVYRDILFPGAGGQGKSES